jgi:hypothetical protein
MLLQSKIECFINNNTKKVFHLQIYHSLLIYKGHHPWHTLYRAAIDNLELKASVQGDGNYSGLAKS